MRIIWFGVCLLLISCSPAELPTGTIPAVQADVPITPAASTATVPPSRIPPTLTPTLLPTATPEPTTTFTPTPSPWLVDRSRPFLFFESSSGIQVGYPDGQFQAIAWGEVISVGQPWSPDGTRFIFRVDGGADSSNIFIADLQTGDIQPLSFIHRTAYIFWSPNGQYILYPEEDEDEDILVMLYDFETDESIVLTTISRESPGAYFYLAGWSPDSRKVAYVTQIAGQYDLFVVAIEEMAIRQLTNDTETEIHVVWSPVTNQLLVTTTTRPDPFIASPFAAQNLYLVDENGEGRRRLVEFNTLDEPAWSPDGNRVAFSDDGRLCILTLGDLSQECPLEAVFPADEFGALGWGFPSAWSSDGQWLAFQVTKLNETPCVLSYVLNLSTNEVVNLEVSSCGATPFYWSPAVP